MYLAHLATGLDSFTDKQCDKNPGKQQTQAQLPPHMANISNTSVCLFTHYSQSMKQPTATHHSYTQMLTLCGNLKER